MENSGTAVCKYMPVQFNLFRSSSMNGAHNTPTWVAVLALAVGLVGIYWTASRATTDLVPDVVTVTKSLFSCEDPSSCIGPSSLPLLSFSSLLISC